MKNIKYITENGFSQKITLVFAYQKNKLFHDKLEQNDLVLHRFLPSSIFSILNFGIVFLLLLHFRSNGPKGMSVKKKIGNKIISSPY